MGWLQAVGGRPRTRTRGAGRVPRDQAHLAEHPSAAAALVPAVTGSDLTMRRLLSTARYEVIPTATIEERVRGAVPTTVPITVTASPAKGLEPTLQLTERLTSAGYRVVPHLSARLIAGPSHLKDIVDRLLTVGVHDVFVPAGDADPPA